MEKKIDFHFKEPNSSPGYLLGQVTQLWERQHKRVLDPLNITRTQFVLLAALGWLSRENEHITQVDIANQSNCDRMMVSKVLRTLEEKKYLDRYDHPTDTRAKVIKLTDEGSKTLQIALTAVENADMLFFSALQNNIATFNQNMIQLLEENRTV